MKTTHLECGDLSPLCPPGLVPAFPASLPRPLRVLGAAIAACSLLAPSALAQHAQPAPDPSAPPPPITVPMTEVRAFHSAMFDVDFLISVALPFSYAKGERTYPAIYFLDGNLAANYASAPCRVLAAHDQLPQAIVVSIGYPCDAFDWQVRRVFDFTTEADLAGEKRISAAIAHTTGRTDAKLRFGGADASLRCLREELIPFVESHYRTVPGERTLAAYSLGGLFATRVLLTQPGLFNRYVIGSPSLHWADGSIFAVEVAYAASHRDLPARVYFSTCEFDLPEFGEGVQRMAERLRSRGYPGLVLSTHVLEEETHISGIGTCFSRGLRVVFDHMPER